MQGLLSPTSSQNHSNWSGNLLIGGTSNNGLVAALLYSGTCSSDWREHSAIKIDDVILKTHYTQNDITPSVVCCNIMKVVCRSPGSQSQADYNADRFHSTRVFMMSSEAGVNWLVLAISSNLITSTSSIF